MPASRDWQGSSRRHAQRDRSWKRLHHVEDRPIPAHPAVNDLAADIEVTYAAKTQPEAAGHLLLHGNLARYVEFPRKPLLHAQQAARPAGEECFTPSVGDEAAQDPLDIGGGAGAFLRPHPEDAGAPTLGQSEPHKKPPPGPTQD